VSTEPRPTATPLQDDEDALREKILGELEREHAERLEKLAARKDRARLKSRERQEDLRAESEKKLKAELRDRFYEEHGYVEYVDGSGRREWVPKEEYEWRMRRRKRSRKSDLPMSNRMREVVVTALAVLVVIMIGIVFVLKR
jgi:hypothetical protein